MTPGVERSAGALDRFLFAPADARCAAVFRLGLAIMIAWSLTLPGSPTRPFLGLPGAAVIYHQIVLTPWFMALTAVVLALFTAGWKPRVTGFLLAVLFLPFASLSIGPVSRHLLLSALVSVSLMRSDRWWVAPYSAGPMWPVRLMQIQLSLVYGVNALAKLTPQYLSGDLLIGMSRMHANFLVDLSDGFLTAGPSRVPVAAAAVVSVIAEAVLAVGFWFRRLRWITAVFGVTFHIAVQQIVRIFMLDWVSMFLYAAFLLPWERSHTRAAAPPAD